MTNEEFTPAAEGGLPTDRRPLGYWLRVVDRLISREFAAALEAEGVSRRDWMLLKMLSGDVDAPDLRGRIARRGKRIRRLEERGWVLRGDDGWQLTDEGRTAKDRLSDIVQGVRARVSGAVSPQDWATLTASLESIARALGWDESEGMPRRPRGNRNRRGFDRDHGFGPGRFGHGPHHGRRPHHGHGSHHGHGRHHEHGFEPDHHCAHDHFGGDHAHAAYERGYDAGYARGREAAASPA